MVAIITRWRNSLLVVVVLLIALVQLLGPNSQYGLNWCTQKFLETNLVATAVETKKYAIVHLLTSARPSYVVALLTSAYCLVNLHQQSNRSTGPVFPHQLDLVVMLPQTESSKVHGFTHPNLRFVFYDPSPIENALQGKKYWLATMHKLAALSLEEYEAIFFLDLDVMVLQPLTSVFLEYTPPAMVYWDMYPKYSFNSGCQLMKPSEAIFNDTLAILQQLGHRDNTSPEIALRATKNFLISHPHELPPSAPVGNWRSDQEFLHSFYNIIPETSRKYGPIHPLSYGYCARSVSVNYATQKFLGGTVTDETTLSDGGLLHVYGGYGHDGQGHWIHETRTEQGINNLYALHFTVDKPWNANLKVPELPSGVTLNATQTPQERCPSLIYHAEYWTSALEALTMASQSNEYGESWTSKPILDLLDAMPLVNTCLVPELQRLRKVLAQNTKMMLQNVTINAYRPLIAPDIRA